MEITNLTTKNKLIIFGSFLILVISPFLISNHKLLHLVTNSLLFIFYFYFGNRYILLSIFINIFLKINFLVLTSFYFYSVIFIFLFLQIFVELIIKKKEINFISFHEVLNQEHINKTSTKIFFQIFIIIFILISQNDLLNYETIDSDVNSYLVMSQEILRGNIPYENQWESKSPFLYLIYSLFILLSSSNLVYFKLLNDFFLYILSYLLYKVVLIKYGNHFTSFTTSLFFVLFISLDWAKTEYSEIYVLFFLILSYLFFIDEYRKKNLFISAIFLSTATLVNQGSGLFFLIFIYVLLKDFRKNKKNLVVYLSGLTLPHFIIFFFYYLNNLLPIYLITLFKIPFSYTKTDFNFFQELVVFFNTVYESNFFLFTLIFFTISITFLSIIYTFVKKEDLDGRVSFEHSFIYLVLISLFYFLYAGKGYYHHLILLIYFLPLLSSQFKSKSLVFIFSTLLFSGVITNFYQNTGESIYNLQNLNKIEEGYPLKKLSIEIDNYFEKDFTVLALDYNLILFYLDKPNFSYIIHPSNHYEDFITDDLVELNMITNNQIIDSINKKPDVVICSGTQIISGKVQKNKEFNCEVSDYYKEYKKLDTKIYKNNQNLNYYQDPYREIGIYLKLYSCDEVECKNY